MFGSLGMPEILMILVIALIIFGPRKLPELGKTLGQSLAHFRKASEDFKRQWEDEVVLEKRKLDTPPPPAESPASKEPYSAEPYSAEPYSAGPVSEESVVTPVEGHDTSELGQSASVPGAISSAEEEPLTVARGDNSIKESKLDWM
jgi:TatA/E family protein of Tat protein translocase